MSLLQLWSIVGAGVLLKIAVVSLLIFTGAPIGILLSGGYALGIVCMLGMQRRARECCDSREYLRYRVRDIRSCGTSAAVPFSASADLPVGLPSHMRA